MRNLNNLAFYFFLLLVAIALTACATEDITLPVEEVDDSESFFNPKEETLIFDDGTNEDIRMFDVESGLLIYDEGSPQLDSVEVGSIIISRPNDEARGGFLRKVTSVENNGGRVVMETEPANLPDAFESYRWRLNGSADGGRSDGDGTFNFNDSDVDTTFTFDIPGVPDWEFQLNFQFKYTLELRSEFDFNIGLSGGQIESMNVGVDRFIVDSIVMEMAFVRGEEATTDQTFTIDDASPYFQRLFTLALTPIPVGPGVSPVYITPSIQLDFSTAMEYEVRLGQRFVFYSTDAPFTGLAQINSPGGPVSFVQVNPGMGVNADIFFEGAFSYGAGLSVGLALSPYSRSLFALGTRVSVGPQLNLSGTASGGLRNGVPAFPLTLDASVELAASAGVFLDADFFGLAPDDWDIEQTLWENTYELWSVGVDNGCGFYFNTLYADAVCSNGNSQLIFSVTRNQQPEVDTDGTYDVYVDNILVGTNYQPEITHTVNLPPTVLPGPHQVRFVREGGQSILFCEDQKSVAVFDCSENDYCNGVTLLVDESTEQAYCIRTFNGDNWFANNLYTLLSENASPNCYGNTLELCRSYGGLYDFNDLLGVDGESSPPTRKGLCPDGYHVPSIADWLELFGEAGLEPASNGVYNLQTSAFPYRANTTWNVGSNPQTPNGFNALASGFYTLSSNAGYTGLGVLSYFWTSDVSEGVGGQSGAYAVIMDGTNNQVKIAPIVRTQGISCRCVAD